MTPKEKEEIQERVLLMCNASGRMGIYEDRLLRDCQRYGFERLTAPELDAELSVLENAGLIQTLEKTLRPDLRKWKTTASGDRWLMEARLI